MLQSLSSGTAAPSHLSGPMSRLMSPMSQTTMSRGSLGGKREADVRRADVLSSVLSTTINVCSGEPDADPALGNVTANNKVMAQLFFRRSLAQQVAEPPTPQFLALSRDQLTVSIRRLD